MKLVADLHVHSVASGHSYSTVKELIEGARNRGLQMIAITDHGPAMPGGPHPYHFGNMRVLPKEYLGIRLLKGVEANIIDEAGNLDLPVEYLAKLDVVLAGFHPDCYVVASREIHTRTILNTFRNPYVDIISHPGNPVYALDNEKIVEEAANIGVALEINNSSLCGSRKGSAENCLEIARLLAESGGPVFIGSDAHWAEDVGRFEYALELVARAGVKEEQIVNTSLDKIEHYLAGRRKSRLLQSDHMSVRRKADDARKG